MKTRWRSSLAIPALPLPSLALTAGLATPQRWTLLPA